MIPSHATDDNSVSTCDITGCGQLVIHGHTGRLAPERFGLFRGQRFRELDVDRERMTHSNRYANGRGHDVEIGRPHYLLRFLDDLSLLERLDRWYRDFLSNGFEPVKRRWEALCDNLGDEVQLSLADGPIQGKVAGIDMKGHLLLELPGGNVRAFDSGEVAEI